MIVVSDCEIWCWKQLPLFKLNMNYMAEKISSLDDISPMELRLKPALQELAGWNKVSSLCDLFLLLVPHVNSDIISKPKKPFTIQPDLPSNLQQENLK